MKLSDRLMLDARLTAQVAERSIAGQIEFWARLGKAIEPLLQGIQSLALSRAGATQSLSSCLRSVDSAEGHARLQTHLQGEPYPHCEPSPQEPGLLVRTDTDGRRTVGRFIRREFTATKPKSGRLKPLIRAATGPTS